MTNSIHFFFGSILLGRFISSGIVGSGTRMDGAPRLSYIIGGFIAASNSSSRSELSSLTRSFTL